MIKKDKKEGIEYFMKTEGRKQEMKRKKETLPVAELWQADWSDRTRSAQKLWRLIVNCEFYLNKVKRAGAGARRRGLQLVGSSCGSGRGSGGAHPPPRLDLHHADRPRLQLCSWFRRWNISGARRLLLSASILAALSAARLLQAPLNQTRLQQARRAVHPSQLKHIQTVMICIISVLMHVWLAILHQWCTRRFS